MMIDRQTGYDDTPEPPECLACPNPVTRAGDHCAECLECLDPMVDDTVHCCPDCERPNQFGEICGECQRDSDTEWLL